MRIRERFNPRAPCGARLATEGRTIAVDPFQPTRPLRGATDFLSHTPPSKLISTHAPLAGRDDLRGQSVGLLLGISTHAPLAGRDPLRSCGVECVSISTHAPLAGRDDVYLSGRRN